MKIYTSYNSTKTLKLIFSACLLLVLSACNSNDGSVAAVETATDVPQFIQKALVVANGNLVAWITIDGGARSPLTINSAAGTASAVIPNLSRSTHTVLIEFEFTDGVDTVMLATATTTVDLSAGDASLSFADADYNVSFDDDNDGISNLQEIIGGINPLLAHFFITADDGTVGRELLLTDGTADGTSLLKDINTNTNSNPSNLVVLNGVTYFAATDGVTGIELWRTNHLTSGTELVKDINTGSASSSPQELTVVGSKLYFRANDGINGSELWVSDGTENGTELVRNINPFQAAGSFPNNLTAVGSTLYFSASDGGDSIGTELWKSDSTAAPIRADLVKDIFPGTTTFGSPNSSSPSGLIAVGSKLYFSASDALNGRELWESDGTDTGTKLVININAGSASSSPSGLTVVGTSFYFSAFDANGREPWISGGTAGSTVMVKDIRAGSSSSPSEFTLVGSTVYFRAFDDTNGSELWKSDGTALGTELVKDIFAGTNTSGFVNSSTPQQLSAVGSTLYFSAFDDIDGQELWKSDGTELGTVRVKDIFAGTNTSGFANSSSPRDLTAVNSTTLLFRANDGISGSELWKSDGTDTGTERVSDINPGVGNGDPREFNVLAGVAYFSAYDGTNGRELWRSDATAAGTSLLADIGQVGGNSNPSVMVTVDGLSYFTANDGASNINALWRTDGTVSGTVLVKDINIQFSGGPSPLTAVGSMLYFSASDNTNGTELWKSDGTDAGTVLVKDINPGTSSSSPGELTSVGSTVYFRASDGVTGSELWKSDGTDVGTVQVRDINFGADSSSPREFTLISTTLYFRAFDTTNGTELWKSDGTELGTELVKDIFAGTNTSGFANSSTPQQLSAVGSTLYFSAFDDIDGQELWKSDGTELGTVLVKDIFAGTNTSGFANSSSPRELTAVGSTLFFRAFVDTDGTELWKSDGTELGTVLVKDIFAGTNTFGNPNSSSPVELTAVGSTLFFRAFVDTDGTELWKSDGTELGTVLVKDIFAGTNTFGDPNSSFPTDLTAKDSTLYFRASDGVTGSELWKSDGTDAGTVLVKDIFAGTNTSGSPNSSSPSILSK